VYLFRWGGGRDVEGRKEETLDRKAEKGRKGKGIMSVLVMAGEGK
jgi:hypothetical protein